MTPDSIARTISVDRVSPGRFVATNDRGGHLWIGTGAEFTPTELLLAAIGTCTAIDVDTLTSRRAEPLSFSVRVDANKVRDDGGNHLTDIAVTFQVEFPTDEGGDAARAILPEAAKKSHDRWCTVGRTVNLGTPIATRFE
jgi:putative redox protein